MAWSGVPISAGGNFLDYGILRQFYRALRERECASNGSMRFPRGNIDYAGGIVQSLSATSVVCNKPDGSDRDFDDDASPIEWPGAFVVPPATTFDIIIDTEADNEWQVVRAQVTGKAGDTLTISNIEDYVASGRIASLASLVGKPYTLIKRTGGLWWNERWMAWPNGHPSNASPLHKGNTTTGGTASVQETGQTWAVDQWVARELLINRDSDGRLQRITITGNTADTLTFATQASSVSGTYLIVPAGMVAELNREPDPPLRWYTGQTNSAVSIKPDEDLVGRELDQVTPFIKPGITISSGSDSICEDISPTIKDRDFWSGELEECSEADKSYQPNIYKTLRMLQRHALYGGGSFVEMRSYHGEPFIPTLNPARLSRVAGVNSLGSVGITPAMDGSGSGTISLPAGCYGYLWELVGPDGVVQEGETAGATTTFGPSAMVFGESYALYAAAGYTRKIPREFRWAYPKKFFVPDLDTASPVVPPTTDFPGLWNDGSGSPSTNYKEFDDDGLVGTSDDNFQTGELARYSGDNPDDPGLFIFSQYAISAGRPDGYDPEEPWYKAAVERADPDGGTARLAVMSGTISSAAMLGGMTWIEDSGKNWYGAPLGSGVLRSETGTATGGSATTLVDTSKIADAFWDTATGRWAGFILEVTRGGTTWRTPITASVQATGTLTFLAVKDAAGVALTVTAGDTYTIREPEWNVSYWRGRTIRLTTPAGVVYEQPILHSDDNRLWFADPAVAVAAGWTYRIVELKVGSVYQWDGSKWVVPTGYGDFDDIGLRGVAPTMKTRYGLMRKGDYAGAWLLNELQDVINELRWTIGPASWSSRANVSVAELNLKNASGGFEGGGEGYPDACVDAVAWWDYFWENVIVSILEADLDDFAAEQDGVPPTTSSSVQFNDLGDGGKNVGYVIVNRWAYPIANGYFTCLGGEVEIYAKAEPPCDDDPDDPECQFDAYGTPMLENVYASMGSGTLTGGRVVLAAIGGADPPIDAAKPESIARDRVCDWSNENNPACDPIPFIGGCGLDWPGEDYQRRKVSGFVVNDTVGIYKWDMGYV